jgi:hypothetical protein
MKGTKQAFLSIVDLTKHTTEEGPKRVLNNFYIVQKYRGRRFLAQNWQEDQAGKLEMKEVVEVPIRHVRELVQKSTNIKKWYLALKAKNIHLLIQK